MRLVDLCQLRMQITVIKNVSSWIISREKKLFLEINCLQNVRRLCFVTFLRLMHYVMQHAIHRKAQLIDIERVHCSFIPLICPSYIWRIKVSIPLVCHWARPGIQRKFLPTLKWSELHHLINWWRHLVVSWLLKVPNFPLFQSTCLGITFSCLLQPKMAKIILLHPRWRHLYMPGDNNHDSW